MYQEEPLMTIPEAAAVLGIKDHRLYYLIRAGSFPSVRIGRFIRLRPDDVKRALAEGM